MTFMKVIIPLIKLPIPIEQRFFKPDERNVAISWLLKD